MIQVIYRDEYLLVVQKPAGLLVHRSELADSDSENLVDLLMEQCACHLYPVHRLDRATTGLIVFATSSDIARQLSNDFARRRVRKRYLALVRGWPEPESTPDALESENRQMSFSIKRYFDCPTAAVSPEGASHFKWCLANKAKLAAQWQLIDYPLAKPKSHWTAWQKRMGKHELEGSAEKAIQAVSMSVKKDARSLYRSLAYIEWPRQVDKYPTSRYAVLELRPETGRPHQLRRHLKHIGHPIIGDVKYGKGTHNRFFKDELGLEGLMLVATGLSFKHPIAGHWLSFSDLPNSRSGEFLRLVATGEQRTSRNTLAA